MRCIVLILATMAGAKAVVAAAASCALSEDFFMRHNVSADDSDEPGAVCGGSCCGRSREGRLAAALQRAAEARAAAAIRPVAALLLSTRNTLQEHLTALSHQSQNKSAVLFAQVYREQGARAHGPLSALYGEVRAALRPAPAPAPASAPAPAPAPDAALLAGAPLNLAATTRNFFRDIFPLAYHNILRLDTKQFTADYEVCLKDAYDAVQPFGDVPQQLGTTLSKSLEGARALLAALGAGAGVLAGGERAAARAAAACAPRLLRAAGCARCQGLDARPCRHYCLNLARGCMGSAVAELEAPWAGFVEAAERLAHADADAALRALDSRLSLAIMHALENHVLLDKKVRQECGTPATQQGLGLTARARAPAASAPRREALRAPPPDAELLQFAASLANTKRLFAALLDQLCDEPDFAHDDNEHCWNGNTVGEYVKPLVASSSLSDQKYNPEIEGLAPQEPAAAALADRLRQARQLLMSSSWSNAPAAEAFMQGDEAGEAEGGEAGSEGSGSGRSYAYDDAAFDAEAGSGDEGSGSSDGIGTIMNERGGTVISSTPKTDGCVAARPAAALLGLALLAAAARAPAGA